MFNFTDMNFGQPEAAGFKGPYLPEAAECLSCGLCVSACPTYRLFGTEEETPRRRVRTLSNL
ncbi:MAG: 4Fe-4S dicluster domain-containing protein [Methylobacter sp.]